MAKVHESHKMVVDPEYPRSKLLVCKGCAMCFCCTPKGWLTEPCRNEDYRTVKDVR